MARAVKFRDVLRKQAKLSQDQEAKTAEWYLEAAGGKSQKQKLQPEITDPAWLRAESLPYFPRNFVRVGFRPTDKVTFIFV